MRKRIDFITQISERKSNWGECNVAASQGLEGIHARRQRRLCSWSERTYNPNPGCYAKSQY